MVHSYYCSSSVPFFDELAYALGAVVAYASRLLLVLLSSRTPFETAVHSLKLVGLNIGLLPPHCPQFLVTLPRSILPAPAGGLLVCL